MDSWSRALLALLWLLAVGAPGTPAWAEECPEAQQVTVDLASWMKQVRAQPPPARMKRLLATLGLPPLPTVEALGEEESCQEELPRLLSLERFQVRLSDAPEEERVLWLSFASCGDEGGGGPSPDVVRGVVLRPLGPGRWCRIEAPFLNADTRSPYSQSPYLCEPPEFSFVHLTSERHRVFRLVETETPCMGSAARHVITRRLSFWELRGTRMRRLFETTLLQSPLSSPGPGSSKVLEARVRIVGESFPRQLAVTERVSEMFSEEQGVARHMRYQLDEVSGRYVRPKGGP
ncbi:MAG TPA: hypothetical protein VF794_05255 [Archangium sp.]|uniref:hypothetical protein n=1 Tax=Archangium sp. TaxID=1872627 RepID=UPI002EDA8FCB